MFPYTAGKAIAMRATADQIALTEFLIHRLNKPAGSFVPGLNEYRITGVLDGVVRLMAVRAATLPEFHQRAMDIRAATGIRRLFPYNTHRVLIMRGTPEQIAEAERLLNAQ
jgi:hypothetical protein